MISTLKPLLAVGMFAGLFAITAPTAAAQDDPHKDHDKGGKVERKTVQMASRQKGAARPQRILCADGAWVVNRGTACSKRGGVASHQGTPHPQDVHHHPVNHPKHHHEHHPEHNPEHHPAAEPAGHANHTAHGAIARCHDGAYWHAKTRTNACHKNGGVASWM